MQGVGAQAPWGSAQPGGVWAETPVQGESPAPLPAPPVRWPRSPGAQHSPQVWQASPGGRWLSDPQSHFLPGSTPLTLQAEPAKEPWGPLITLPFKAPLKQGPSKPGPPSGTWGLLSRVTA